MYGEMLPIGGYLPRLVDFRYFAYMQLTPHELG